MNYAYIKDKVIETTHSLRLIPTDSLEYVLGEDYGVLTQEVRGMLHYGIKVVVHGFMASGLHKYEAVCTVLVDNKPAFFFHVNKNNDDEDSTYYLLDTKAYLEYVKYLLEMVTSFAMESKSWVEVADEDIPILSRMESSWPPYTKYGTAYIRYQDQEGSGYWPHPFEEDVERVGLRHHLGAS